MFALNKLASRRDGSSRMQKSTVVISLIAASAMGAVIAAAGASFADPRPVLPKPATISGAESVPQRSAGAPRGGYRLRCWQYGRLLFDEPLAQIPAEAPGMTFRLQGDETQASAYSLIDTRAATCLVKPVGGK